MVQRGVFKIHMFLKDVKYLKKVRQYVKWCRGPGRWLYGKCVLWIQIPLYFSQAQKQVNAKNVCTKRLFVLDSTGSRMSALHLRLYKSSGWLNRAHFVVSLNGVLKHHLYCALNPRLKRISQEC